MDERRGEVRCLDRSTAPSRPEEVTNALPEQVAAVVSLKFINRGHGNITVTRVLVRITLNLYRNRLAFCY